MSLSWLFYCQLVISAMQDSAWTEGVRSSAIIMDIDTCTKVATDLRRCDHSRGEKFLVSSSPSFRHNRLCEITCVLLSDLFRSAFAATNIIDIWRTLQSVLHATI